MLDRTAPTDPRQLAVTLGTYGHSDFRCLNISHGSTKSAASITFQRTLRVPDNQDTNSLPPSLGQFPLYSVAEYKDRMPEDMAQQGGVFLPMYQREAMWIQFSALEPFALKIYVGGVNAISGVPINERPEKALERLRIADKVKQDYVVLPEQPWLDGIASEDGKIMQFVAMPKGSGYSVEAQVTGEEKIGGLQFELTPVKRVCPKKLRLRLHGGQRFRTTQEVELDTEAEGLNDMSRLGDLMKVIERKFQIKEEHQAFSVQAPGFSGAYGGIQDKLFSESWLTEFHVINVIIREPDNEPTGFRGRGVNLRLGSHGGMGVNESKSGAGLSASDEGYDGGLAHFDFDDFLKPSSSVAFVAAPMMGMAAHAGPSTPLNGGHFMMCSTSTVAPPPPPAPSGVPYSAKHVAEMKISGYAPAAARAATPAKPAAPKVKSMGLAAGGLITQSINEDKYPPEVWDKDASILFNVQLLNAESFTAVTGLPPPETPVDAKTYAEHGYPFFQIWDEEVSGIKGDFGKIKSVGALDEDKAKKEKEEFWAKMEGNEAGELEGVEIPRPFERDESIDPAIIVLDMSQRRTFKPLKEMEIEAQELKAGTK